MGLAFAKGCAFEGPLYVTDQKEMFSLMQHNIVLNDLGDRVKGAILNWSVLPLLLPASHAGCLCRLVRRRPTATRRYSDTAAGYTFPGVSLCRERS